MSQQPARPQVVLLRRGVDHRAVVGAALAREVARDVLLRGHPGVVADDLEAVERERPAVDALAASRPCGSGWSTTVYSPLSVAPVFVTMPCHQASAGLPF